MLSKIIHEAWRFLWPKKNMPAAVAVKSIWIISTLPTISGATSWISQGAATSGTAISFSISALIWIILLSAGIAIGVERARRYTLMLGNRIKLDHSGSLYHVQVDNSGIGETTASVFVSRIVSVEGKSYEAFSATEVGWLGCPPGHRPKITKNIPGKAIVFLRPTGPAMPWSLHVSNIHSLNDPSSIYFSTPQKIVWAELVLRDEAGKEIAKWFRIDFLEDRHQWPWFWEGVEDQPWFAKQSTSTSPQKQKWLDLAVNLMRAVFEDSRSRKVRRRAERMRQAHRKET
jgi:hypothetical protein